MCDQIIVQFAPQVSPVSQNLKKPGLASTIRADRIEQIAKDLVWMNRRLAASGSITESNPPLHSDFLNLHSMNTPHHESMEYLACSGNR